MPCIAVGGAGSAGWVAEGETQAGAAVEGADGNDKPHVLGDDVERQKIDFGGQIGRENGLLSAGSVGAAAGFDAVAGLGMAGGSGFDLDAEELLTVVGDEIVRVGVAEGLGYGEAEGRGSLEESDFTHFPAALWIFAHGFAHSFSGKR